MLLKGKTAIDGLAGCERGEAVPADQGGNGIEPNSIDVDRLGDVLQRRQSKIIEAAGLRLTWSWTLRRVDDGRLGCIGKSIELP